MNVSQHWLGLLAGVLSLGGFSQVAAQAVPPEGPGRDETVRACSQCHAFGMATAKRYSPDEWRQVIRRMVGLGAPIAGQELPVIENYLIAHYGANGSSQTFELPAEEASSIPKYPRPEGENQWPAYGGGGANQNYSPLTTITPLNVRNLKHAWTYRYGAGDSDSGDEGIDFRFEVTPLVIGGVMYVSTPAAPRAPNLKASITALIPETGEVLWKYESPLNIHGRGLAYWPGNESIAPRLFFGTDGGYIVAVDVTTGRPASGFGRGGRIDAYVGVASEIVGESRRSTFSIPNPVSVYRNLIISGSRPGEVGPPGPRGDIRAWDAITGRLVWTFHTVPQPGEPGHETYSGDEWRDVSGANVWSTMALDEENGIIFAPTGDLNSTARGSHLYANSLLALDANTGKLKWYRQITHRDIWDWDLPTPPVLFDFEKDGRRIPAVFIVGKHGLMFVFDRFTGEALNGFEERPTPQPDPPSDEVWPTQPFPHAPGQLARAGMTREEIPDLVPGMREYCTEFWDKNRIVSVPLYAPRVSSRHGVLSYPSTTGGPNWGGGAFHPELGFYFINVQNIPTFRAAVAPGSSLLAQSLDPQAWARPPGPRQRRVPPFSFAIDDGHLSCAATPWGELVAVDMKRLDVAWRVPLGITKSLGERGLATGAPNLGGSIVTASGVVFIAATNDARFRAFDARTGKMLWEADLPAGGHATPITYIGRDGRQYVTIAAAGGTSAGGPKLSDALVTFVLPK
jgi:glucose dehydrogenase